MDVHFDITLSKSQREAWDLIHDKRYKYITLAYSRQSGKTILMLCLCVEWLTGKNNQIAYICRNYILAKKLYRELIRILPKEFIKGSNATDFTIESIYGSTLTFFSAESGSSLRGQTFTHAILDEFAFHKQEQPDGTLLWNDILSPTLKARGKKCIFVSTPLGKNIFYQMYQRGLSEDFPNYASIKKTIYDDGFITEEQIEEIKKSIPDMSFRSEYLCEFMDDANTFFVGYGDCFDIDKFNRNCKEWIGVDLSSTSNGDATIISEINEYDEVTQEEVRGGLDAKYKRIAEIINKRNPVAVYLENNGVGLPMINEIKKLVKNKNRIYEWTTTNASKEEIISDLAVAIANRNIHFLKDDIKLYNELGDFVVTFSKTRKLTFAARGNAHDDRCLSLAIARRAKQDHKYTGTNNNIFIQSSTQWLK